MDCIIEIRAAEGGDDDKRRTIRMQADDVQDHVLGRSLKAKGYLKGKLGTLYGD